MERVLERAKRTPLARLRLTPAGFSFLPGPLPVKAGSYRGVPKVWETSRAPIIIVRATNVHPEAIEVSLASSDQGHYGYKGDRRVETAGWARSV